MICRRFHLFVLTAVLASCGRGVAATPQTGGAAPSRSLANNEATYLRLRNIGLSQEVIQVNGFRMKKDAGIFTFRSGRFYMLEPVNGVTTGAVFIGDASFALTPPLESEQRYLSFLAKEEFVEQFKAAVFRFTDGTETEIRKAASPATENSPAEAVRLLREINQQLRKDLKENLDVRLLEDLLSSRPRGKFVAFIKGEKYGSKLIYDIDPNGVVSYSPDPSPRESAGPRIQDFISLAPEEVALISWDYNHYGIWASFHREQEYTDKTASSGEQNNPFKIDSQKLETAIAKNGAMDGLAQTRVTALRDGVRVLCLDLFPTLRVDHVEGEQGEPLQFIQEAAEEDANFAVILPRELKKGDSYTFTTRYAGKHAVSNEGNGNYFPIARNDWYPAMYVTNYSSFDMTFRVPKGLRMVATGKLLKNFDDEHQSVTVWRSDASEAVAGFNFGEFKTQQAMDLSNHYSIETDVNELLPAGLPHYMSTVSMMKKATAEAQVALDLYTNYFGEEPYRNIAMTQQTAQSFGQSWPGLVFLPLSYFLDSTYRHFELGHGNEHGFFEAVGPHEIAHQWWGHMVGWDSYRDQWMSEGFAEMSASLFLQAVYTEHKLREYHQFWAEERRRLMDVNGERKRAIDVGPVTMGYRLASAKTGFNIPRDLIYPKGGYILQMIRFMMQDSRAKDVDARFKAMMQDFTSSFALRPASTEDFKTVVERHMTPEMDLAGNHRMDWFFNEYVYGTEFPSYSFEYSFSNDADGSVVFNFKLTQSKVSKDFVMLVPIYVELEKGQVARLGRAAIHGDTSVERHVRLPGLRKTPVRAIVAYMDDVLGDIKDK